MQLNSATLMYDLTHLKVHGRVILKNCTATQNSTDPSLRNCKNKTGNCYEPPVSAECLATSKLYHLKKPGCLYSFPVNSHDNVGHDGKVLQKKKVDFPSSQSVLYFFIFETRLRTSQTLALAVLCHYLMSFISFKLV